MENKWSLFEKFIITQDSNISVVDFLINSALLVIMTWLLSFTYQKTGRSLSNRKDFGSNFMLLSFTTMLVITIVKSSLALSLGLVGALSIVRFRAAIKEPEELAYLFFAISLGLGLGANQVAIVSLAFAILLLILWVRYLIGGKSKKQNLFITINAISSIPDLSEIEGLMKKYFKNFYLKRYDNQDESMEMSFVADINKIDVLDSFQKDLRDKYPKINISYLDSKAY